jgi:hypothetical protein
LGGFSPCRIMYTLGGFLADTAARPKKRYANAERKNILKMKINNSSVCEAKNKRGRKKSKIY